MLDREGGHVSPPRGVSRAGCGGVVSPRPSEYTVLRMISPSSNSVSILKQVGLLE
jgi:hypothetical protein